MNLYIFPTIYLLEQFKNTNKDFIGDMSVINDLMTFDGFADYIIKDTTIGMRQIGELEKFFVLSGTASNINLQYFVNLKKGYIKSIGSVISELKLQNISYEDLKRILPDSKKRDDIYRIYKSYQEYLKRNGLFDNEDRYLLGLNHNIENYISQYEKIIFYDFYDLTAVQRNIIETIGKKAEIKNDTLKTGENDIKIAQVKDRLTEVYNLAHRIIKDLKEGLSFDDIAIVIRDPEIYSDYMNEIFESAYIPLDSGYSEYILKNPFVKGLIAFLENNVYKDNKYFKEIVFDSTDKTFGEWMQIVKDIIDFMNYPEYLLEATGDIGFFARDLKAFECLNEFIDIIIKRDGNDTAHNKVYKRDEFVSTFKDYLRELTYTTGNSSNGIKILTPAQLRGLQFKKIYVLGMLDGEYPKNFAPDWLIKDDERALINTYGYNIDCVDLLMKRERKSLDFVSNTARNIYISYPNMIEGSKSTLKSPFISEIMKNAVNKDFEKVDFEDVFVVDKYSFDLCEHGGIKITMDSFINNFIFSTTSVESYIQCPYKFFLSYILKLKIEEEEQFDAAKEGSVYHEVLRVFIENHKDGLNKDDADDYYKEIDELLTHFMDNEYKDMFDSVELYRLKLDEMSEMLHGMVDFEFKLVNGGFKPYKTEFPFGRNNNLNIGGMKFKGIIDRIDKSSDGRCIVYDYKRSMAPKNEDIEELKNIQMPVYIKAAEKFYGNVVCGAFISIKDAGVKTIVAKDKDLPFVKRKNKGIMDEDKWKSFFNMFEEALKERLSDMKNGIYCVKPTDCPKDNMFSYCDYTDICRYISGGE